MRSTWNGGTRETHYAELVLIRQAYIDSADVRNCSREEEKKHAGRLETEEGIR